MSKEDLYTRKKFIKLKDAFGLSNEDLADIVGLKSGTVKNQVSSYSNKVSTWMRAFIYMYERMQNLEDEVRETDAMSKKLIMENKRALKTKATKAKMLVE